MRMRTSSYDAHARVRARAGSGYALRVGAGGTPLRRGPPRSMKKASAGARPMVNTCDTMATWKHHSGGAASACGRGGWLTVGGVVVCRERPCSWPRPTSRTGAFWPTAVLGMPHGRTSACVCACRAPVPAADGRRGGGEKGEKGKGGRRGGRRARSTCTSKALTLHQLLLQSWAHAIWRQKMSSKGTELAESERGVWCSLKMFGICAPCFNRNYELILFRGRKTILPPNSGEPSCSPVRAAPAAAACTATPPPCTPAARPAVPTMRTRAAARIPLRPRAWPR